MTEKQSAPLILALPKGRILKALRPVLLHTGLDPASDCLDESSRRLRFPTANKDLDVVRVRSFDVATFVAYGGADIGVCGADVLMEFDYPDLYAPLDLGIGACRISVARLKESAAEAPEGKSRLRVATKYPTIARRHFASRAINAEIVHLHGAMELAPSLDMADVIVDLVDTGSTLKANGLEEIETIAHVTSRLIVNRIALKTRPEEIGVLIERFRSALLSSTQ
ncbi:ATP phosphoribosyltransferase [Aristophania vespae]|uniref:ATP phosphoribosyltransferase n=1 Tax=Aristophania vespae TaxID=2697033 RepID=A0A6P1NFG4_9PROT|nr:ATP phosphoribosyltransferase [Aristophania vespae]QHI96188.1 ATP phosphoribosyltransferase [Aristophania vespae]UMM63979.1 ATP phosphoribosyltransferase [Aristophania vespae]